MTKELLIVASEFPPMPGGIGNHAFCLGKEFVRQNYSVRVLTEKREAADGDWTKLLSQNDEIEIIGIRRRNPNIATYLERLRKFYSLTRRNTDQYVIFSGKFPIWLNGLLPAKKSVAVIHGSEIKQTGFFRILFKRGLLKMNRIVCVSNYTKDILLKEYGELDKRKIVVINNGFEKKGGSAPLKKLSPEREINLITVGGIHRRKGQFNVVRCLPELLKQFPRLTYHIAGLPVQKDELAALVRDLNVEKSVFFYHGLDDRKIAKLLKNSDIFLMLSEHLENGDFEGFGIALIEAAAEGLPSVGSLNSGIADAVCDGCSGKLVDPKNTKDIISALEEIINDYDAYSIRAAEWSQKFLWKNKIKEYRSLLEQL